MDNILFNKISHEKFTFHLHTQKGRKRSYFLASLIKPAKIRAKFITLKVRVSN